MTPLAITMGDPCGIGPEITLRACADPRRTAPVVVIGDLRVLARAAEVVGTRLKLRPITSVDRAEHTPGTVDVIAGSDLPHGLPDDLPWGRSTPARARRPPSTSATASGSP
jgi:4-hydroxy-L-threonine phosphate dehydrogenase PdxA